MGIPVKLQVFEGPLDLLLHLIDKNKIDIYDIPIVEITNQYMDYIRAMEREDLNVMSEFLVMAATLLDIKCRMLLPKEVKEDGEEEDPRQELVEQLLEYKMYKYMSYELRDREAEGQRALYRAPDSSGGSEGVCGAHRHGRAAGGSDSGEAEQHFPGCDPQAGGQDRSGPQYIRQDREGDGDADPQRMEDIRTFARKSRRFSFRELLTSQKSRTQIVVTFLAVLQMMKEGSIRTEQEQPFDDILITWTED